MMMMMTSFFLGGGRGKVNSHIKRTRFLSYLLGVKNAVLASLMVFSLNGSATETLVAPFRVSENAEKC